MLTFTANALKAFLALDPCDMRNPSTASSMGSYPVIGSVVYAASMGAGM